VHQQNRQARVKALRNAVATPETLLESAVGSPDIVCPNPAD
jgi:hypothetical protein